jgi:uncharacterized protein YqhQ
MSEARPVAASTQPFHYGGQAVIEGVMMRGRTAMAVAVRHPSGEVVVHTEPLNSRLYRSPWSKRPFIRGMLMLWDTLALGMRALVFSANVALEEEEGDEKKDLPPSPSPAGGGTVAAPTSVANAEDHGAAEDPPLPSERGQEGEVSAAQAQAKEAAKDAFAGKAMWGTMVFALLFGIGLFFVSPLLLTELVGRVLPASRAPLLSVAIEGLIRIAIFFTYVWLIGRVPDVRRVFAYHGAEHKTINAYEAGEPLTPGRVGRYSVAHPRCGTAFLLYVVVLSIFVFGMLGRPPLPVRLLSRVALVPVIASVAYEVIRFSGRRQHVPAVRALLVPGLALQSLTTREPDDSQVEVAIKALERVLEVDGVLGSGGQQTGPAPAIV